MANTSTNVGVKLNIIDGFDLWKVIMVSTLCLQGCAKSLEENKSVGMNDATWKLLNHKTIAHIYMAVPDEVLDISQS